MSRWMVVVAALFAVTVGACSKNDGESVANRFQIPPLDPELVEQARTDSTVRASIPLAYVGGEPIDAGVLETQLHILLKEETRKEFKKNPDVLQIALSAVLDQIVMAKEAEELGIGLTQAEKNELYLTRVRMISDHYLKTVVWDRAKPSEEELHRVYDENQSAYLNPYQVMTRHILVDSESKAMELKKLIDGGADFVQLCRENSKDEVSREVGGFQGWLDPTQPILGVGKNRGYVDRALTLDTNETGIYKTNKGWHVIQVTEKRGGGLKPFEEVKDGLEKTLVAKRWNEAYNQVTLELRDKYDVAMNPEGMGAYAQVEDTVQRTFALAQAQGDATGKIELWRKVVFDYPKSKLAPEAQFMIAYTFLTEKRDDWEAHRQVDRLLRGYPDSDWAKAGKLLQKYIDPDAERSYSTHPHDEYGGHDLEPLNVPQPSELLKQAREGSQ